MCGRTGREGGREVNGGRHSQIEEDDGSMEVNNEIPEESKNENVKGTEKEKQEEKRKKSHDDG